MTRFSRTHFASLAATAISYTRPHYVPVQPLHENMTLAHELWHAPVDQRRARLAALPHPDLLDVFTVIGMYEGSPYDLWRDTPVGFAEDVLGMQVTREEHAVLNAAATETRVVARIPAPGNHEVAAVLTAWASLRLWERQEWTPAIVAASQRNAAYTGHVLGEMQRIACLPGAMEGPHRWTGPDWRNQERLMGYIGWEPEHFVGLRGLHFAVLPDADRIASSSMGSMLDAVINPEFAIVRRIVALSGADRPPTPWATESEQGGHEASERSQ